MLCPEFRGIRIVKLIEQIKKKTSASASSTRKKIEAVYINTFCCKIFIGSDLKELTDISHILKDKLFIFSYWRHKSIQELSPSVRISLVASKHRRYCHLILGFDVYKTHHTVKGTREASNYVLLFRNSSRPFVDTLDVLAEVHSKHSFLLGNKASFYKITSSHCEHL